MAIFGLFVPIYVLIIFAIVIALIVALIVATVKSSAGAEVPDVDTRENYGNFHGLLTKDDFELRADNHELEIYRQQWIVAEPGDEKDQCLLLYLAFKQLLEEQKKSEQEMTEEQSNKRMDEILTELSEKTGITIPDSEENIEVPENIYESDEEFYSEENDEDKI